MKGLDAFSAKDLRTAERVIKLIAGSKYTVKDLFKFNEVMTAKIHQEPKKSSKPRTRDTKRPAKKAKPNMRAPKLLKPGETLLTDVRCTCGGKLLAEGVCGGTAMSKGFIRLLICIECNKDFKIR